MKRLPLLASILFAASFLRAAPVPLFDGQTLLGWEGDAKLWRVQDGSLTGGSLTQTVARNEFLATTRDFTNFIVRLKIKLTGTEGFINSGFQIRSQRVPNNSEMAGYQCDYGEPNWYGCVYDESRRNKVMSPSDMKALGPVIKRQDWNEYVIRADGPRIQTWINGVQGTDYTEADPAIPGWGKLGIQVHGGGKALVQVKEITIEELPPTPPGKIFRGAPEPKKSAKASPLLPEEERASFTLPPGFAIELVASEDMDAGIGKFVTVDWDLHGRMWSMTALEYPVDGNENPAAAKELYASRAKDKVVVFDRDPKSSTGYSPKARVFADGLAIPLGTLPYKNGVYVQHGPEIIFLSDTDGDGKADKRDVILTGFGVQDSHLFPHQFTRAPGNWIWMAQGAFNYGKVKTTNGAEVKFDQTRMAKFRYDGSDFDITSQGPCNIWGLVLTAEGEAWIQEANDYGYPVMPFHEYANYPGCSDSQFKSYAPEFPGTAPDFQMGGTGLSGLALSDVWAEKSEIRNPKSERSPKPESRNEASEAKVILRNSELGFPSDFGFRPSGFPPPYADVMYVANPITRKVQAIKITRDGPRFRYQKLPDFVQSSDEMFRPVSIHFGPDGCLYIVDWYNKIISHNEVPRNHPERDKKRGRIWRVKHSEQKPFDVPDFMKLSGDELIAKLGGESTPQSHLAWQAVTDRQMKELAPRLKNVVRDNAKSAGKRIAALWALEGLDGSDQFSKGAEYLQLLKPLLADTNRNVRREAVRVLGVRPPAIAGASAMWSEGFDAFESAAEDSDPQVRAEAIKALAQWSKLLLSSSDPRTADLRDRRALPLLLRMAKQSLDGPTAKSTQNASRTIKVAEAYEREFERYLVRLLLEQYPIGLAQFLDSDAAKTLPVENRLLATLALDPKSSAQRVAQLLPQLTRPPGQEQVLRLAQFLDEPSVSDALKKVLQQPTTSAATLEALMKVRTRLDSAKLTPLLSDAAKQLLARTEPKEIDLGIKLASAFQIVSAEPQLADIASRGWENNEKLAVLSPQSLSALRALREMRSDRVDLFVKVAEHGDVTAQSAAVDALAAARSERGAQMLVGLYSKLNANQRHTALTSLAGNKIGANAIVKSVKSGVIEKEELDASTLDKLHTLLGDNPDLAALLQQMSSLLQPVARFEGKPDTYVATKYTLAGPFTVECWLKLDPGINNEDGILAAPGQLDLNFFASQFRVWVGGPQHDIAIAKRKTLPDVWTHYAVTRDAQGVFRIYINGELDATSAGRNTNTFDQLDVGRTNKNGGTAGWMNEFRVWNLARSPEQILADFDRTYRGECGIQETGNNSRVRGLVSLLTGTQWPSFHNAVKIQSTMDAPPLLDSAAAKALAEKFAKFRALAGMNGNAARGQQLFTTTCLVCHQAGGQGAGFAPNLDGAGLRTIDGLMRAILTPSAAMEAGYRSFRVETKDGEIQDGFLASQDATGVVLRQPNVEPRRIPAAQIKRAAFRNVSIMPDGLLESMEPQQVRDLFAYLKSMK